MHRRIAARPPVHAALTALTWVALALCLATAASAQDAPRTQIGMFDASDPRGIASLMQRAGYEATLTKDDEGNPLINGRLSRSAYSIHFYECERGLFCNSVQFLSEAPAPPSATLEAANTFNVAWRYARATLVNNKVRLQMDVNLDAGVTADNLRDTLDIWRQLLAIFERDFLSPT